MSAPAHILDLARRIVAIGPTRLKSSDSGANQGEWAVEKLRGPLTKLAGAAGFSSLLSRALVLAKRQSPSLEGMRVGPDGSLVRSTEAPPTLHLADLSGDVEAVLVAEFLFLIFTLIGASQTLRLVREGWPDAPIDSAAFRNEEKP